MAGGPTQATVLCWCWTAGGPSPPGYFSPTSVGREAAAKWGGGGTAWQLPWVEPTAKVPEDGQMGGGRGRGQLSLLSVLAAAAAAANY